MFLLIPAEIYPEKPRENVKMNPCENESQYVFTVKMF